MPALLAPRYWGVHLLALVLVGAAGWLGYWQFEAWQMRRAAEAVDLTRVVPVPLAEVIGADDPFPADKVGHPVVVGGSWLPEATFYVSGRRGGDPEAQGYWAVTPLSVESPDAAGAALLVVRGWTAETATAPPAPTGEAELVAWLQPTEGSVEMDADPADDVFPALRVADALQRVDQDLYGAYGVIAGSLDDAAINDGTDGLAPASLEQLPEASRFTALRNLLYGIEWWVFGLFAAFIWWRHVRDEHDRLRAQDQPAVLSEP